jgi:DmsE family decaheme c-type cytochrome
VERAPGTETGDALNTAGTAPIRTARLRGRATAAATLLAAIALALSACSPSRTAPPPAVAAPPPADAFVGAELCKACHPEPFARFAGTKMGRLFLNHPRDAREKLACEGCHGPGRDHVAAGGRTPGGMITFARKDPTPVETRNAVCLACHTKGARLFWQGSPHDAREVACTGCHTVMRDVSAKSALARPTEIETCGTCHLERRAQQMRFSHMPLREGKMTCTSCHDPHGTVTPALLKENSTNDNCYRCHADKRGPFLWEHPPVTESCVNCHDAHGSNHEKMLKVATFRLCQQCHIESRHPTNPFGRDTGSLKFVLGRACSSCHVNIHGSNHPSGFAFTR